MDPVSLLIGAMVLSGFITKWVQNGRTDREYAKQGMVSPRHQVRLKRLNSAGITPKTGGGPLRDYLAALWADAWLDAAERRRIRRANRPPYDPTKPRFATRFADRVDAAVLGGLARARRRWGVRAADDEPTAPVRAEQKRPHVPGTWTVGPDGQRVPLASPPEPESSPAPGTGTGSTRDPGVHATSQPADAETGNRPIDSESFRFDHDPTVDSRNPDAYAKYAARLDEVCPGWWNSPKLVAGSELHQLAQVRRDREARPGATGGGSEGGDSDADHAPASVNFNHEPSSERTSTMMQTNHPSAGGPGYESSEVNTNEEARRAFARMKDAAARGADALAALEEARAAIAASAQGLADGMSAKRFDQGATAAANEAVDAINLGTVAGWSEQLDTVQAAASKGLSDLDKYRDSEELVAAEQVDTSTLDSASS